MKYFSLSLLSILFSVLLMHCSGEDSIRAYTKQFLLPSGTERGKLGTPGGTPNSDIIPVPAGHLNFDNGWTTILDHFNHKIMRYTHSGKLLREVPLPKDLHKRLHTSLVVNNEGTTWFLSGKNSPEGRIFSIWKLRKGSFERIATRKPFTVDRRTGSMIEKRLSIPTRIYPIDDDRIALVWSTMVSVNKRNMMGRAEALGSKYTISRLEIITPGAKTNHQFEIDEAFFIKQDNKELRFESINQVIPDTAGENLLVKAIYKDLKQPRIVKRLFRVRIRDGKTRAIDTGSHGWSGLLGVTDSGSIYLLDRVYSRKNSSRATISIWDLSGSKVSSFTIESNPAKNNLGDLFLSRSGTLFSYEVIHKTVYSNNSGLLFVSWR